MAKRLSPYLECFLDAQLPPPMAEMGALPWRAQNDGITIEGSQPGRQRPVRFKTRIGPDFFEAFGETHLRRNKGSPAGSSDIIAGDGGMSGVNTNHKVSGASILQADPDPLERGRRLQHPTICGPLRPSLETTVGKPPKTSLGTDSGQVRLTDCRNYPGGTAVRPSLIAYSRTSAARATTSSRACSTLSGRCETNMMHASSVSRS